MVCEPFTDYPGRGGKSRPSPAYVAYKSADLQSRLENLELHDTYLRSDEIESLKIRFYLLLERYQAMTHTPAADAKEIVTDLENARSQLASTSLGLEFLIERVNEVRVKRNQWVCCRMHPLEHCARALGS
jgi:hypothetical protein